VIECGPAARLDKARVATPLVSAEEPSVVAPSLKVTLPPGVPVPAEVDTVALSVTLCPNVDGLLFEVIVAVVSALFTVCVRTVDVLPPKVASPPYTAVIEWELTARLDVAKVAVPLVSADEPSVVAPSLKVTLPPGVPVPDIGAMVAVKVTCCP
jgi:hypothetical protein